MDKIRNKYIQYLIYGLFIGLIYYFLGNIDSKLSIYGIAKDLDLGTPVSVIITFVICSGPFIIIKSILDKHFFIKSE